MICQNRFNIHNLEKTKNLTKLFRNSYLWTPIHVVKWPYYGKQMLYSQ